MERKSKFKTEQLKVMNNEIIITKYNKTMQNILAKKVLRKVCLRKDEA